MVDDLAPTLSVNGCPGTLWLTKQKRVDRDYAVFGEASFDVTPQITLTGGGRYYKFDNTLFGFFGFGRNPAFIQGDDITGIRRMLPAAARPASPHASPTSGRLAARSQIDGTDTTFVPDACRHAVHQRRRVRERQGRAQAEQGQRLHPPLQRAVEAA